MRQNLRGRRALVVLDGVTHEVEVVTHIRDGLWLVEGPTLDAKPRWKGDTKRHPHRLTVRETALQVLPDGTDA